MVTIIGDRLGESDGPSVGITEDSMDGCCDGDSEISIGFIDGTDVGAVVGAKVGATIGAMIGALVVTGTVTGADVTVIGIAVGDMVGGDVTVMGAGVVGASDVKYTSAAPCVKEQVVYK